VRLDHLLSKEQFSSAFPTQVGEWLAETVSDPFVVRLELMGGTLTAFIAYDTGSVRSRDGYTDTLLGPERTRECVFSGKTNDPMRSSSKPPAGNSAE
jgi:hypothetical protein